MRTKLLIAALAAITLVASLTLAQSQGLLHLPVPMLAVARWIAVAALAAYASARRTLAAWILVAMAAGAEIGVDFPAFAVHLKLLADIFLRLIKVIIAPLLFGTLVTGIAGHADIKSVGRMGVKALVYFEVVTTFALLVGLGAINLSRAGVGVKLSPQNPTATA